MRGVNFRPHTTGFIRNTSGWDLNPRGLINAGALGKVGVVIGWDEKVIQSLSKLQGYLDFLWEHDKLPQRLHNVFILGRIDFLEALKGESKTIQV